MSECCTCYDGHCRVCVKREEQRQRELVTAAHEEGKHRAIDAVVDYLRHIASGYALMRSIKANGAREALYGVADKLEKDYRAALGSRLASPQRGEEGDVK